jgi:hypothetical protein
VKKLAVMACFGMLLWASTAAAVNIHIPDPSTMPITVQVTDLGGLYEYKVDLIYTDSDPSPPNPVDHSNLVGFWLWPQVSNPVLTERRGDMAIFTKLYDLYIGNGTDKSIGPNGETSGFISFSVGILGEGMVYGEGGGFTFTSTDYYAGPMSFAYDNANWVGPADTVYRAGTTIVGSAVPIPPAGLLLGSGLLLLIGAGRRQLGI